MSFWSKLGKGLLKVAPIAAAFIPGVGPLASMAIGAGTSALDKKLSGGSWMDTLKAGAIGGATGYAGAKIPTKGLSPTKGFWGKAGDIAKKTGTSILRNSMNQGGARSTGGFDEIPRPNASSWQTMLGDVVNRAASGRGGDRQGAGGYAYGRNQEDRGQAIPRGGGNDSGLSRFTQRMRHQLGPVMGQSDQNNPNLALSLGAGRMDAMRNQPFRGGYSIYSEGPEPQDDEMGNVGPQIETQMPPIYPNSNRRRVAGQQALY